MIAVEAETGHLDVIEHQLMITVTRFDAVTDRGVGIVTTGIGDVTVGALAHAAVSGRPVETVTGIVAVTAASMAAGHHDGARGVKTRNIQK